MTIGKVLIQYGFSEADKYTHIKWFGTGDSSSKVGGTGSIANLHTTAAATSDVNGLDYYANLYIRALEEVVQPGVKILVCSLEQYSDNDNFALREVIHSAQLDFPDFTPLATNLPKAGPRGRPFIGGKQAVPDTHRYGWLRFHYLAGNYMSLPTNFLPSAVTAAFATYYNRLRDLGSSITGYRTLTSALQTYITDEPMDLPTASLFMGVRNG